LLERAGHTGFRDARGPLGLTQRQANGKFTRDEAQAFIEQLEQELESPPPPSAVPAAVSRQRPRATPPSPALRDVPSETLAAELQRRGWIVVEP
jgi:hypothetical protein